MAWHLSSPPEKDGWVKYFRDESIEYGYDQDVDGGRASWTRGKQDDMCGVSVRSGDITIYLMAENGEKAKFWQSDDYEVILGNRKPTRVVRRIEQKVGDKTWRIIEIDLKTRETREYTSKHKI
jgi:hypothetical protein